MSLDPKRFARVVAVEGRALGRYLRVRLDDGRELSCSRVDWGVDAGVNIPHLTLTLPAHDVAVNVVPAIRPRLPREAREVV